MGELKMKNKLKVQRAIHDITQAELAKKIGMSTWSINQMESNRFTPSLHTAYKLAKYFDVTIEDIFSFEGDYTRADELPEWKKDVKRKLG